MTQPSIMGSIKSASKKNFLTGIVVLIPVIITIVVITWLFNLIDGIMAPIYDKILGRHIAGLGFISTIIVIYLVGMISSNVFGKRII